MTKNKENHYEEDKEAKEISTAPHTVKSAEIEGGSYNMRIPVKKAEAEKEYLENQDNDDPVNFRFRKVVNLSKAHDKSKSKSESDEEDEDDRRSNNDLRDEEESDQDHSSGPSKPRVTFFNWHIKINDYFRDLLWKRKEKRVLKMKKQSTLSLLSGPKIRYSNLLSFI